MATVNDSVQKNILVHCYAAGTSIRTQGAPGGPPTSADPMLLDEPPLDEHHPENGQSPAATRLPDDVPNSADAPKPVSLTGARISVQKREDGDEDMLPDGDGAGGMESEDGSVSGDSSQDVSMGRSSQGQDDEATLEEEEVGFWDKSS